MNPVMGRVRRVDIGGRVYHVLNRANFRSRLFRKAAHYQAFLGIVENRPSKWLNHPQGKEEIEEIRQPIQRNRDPWKSILREALKES